MNTKNLFKGIIIGIAKIIPGLSGAVLMISFNLYDKTIAAITNFFDSPQKNFFFLLNLSLGITIGIIGFSNILNYFVLGYYTYTTSLFIGLILGGIPILFTNTNKDKKTYYLITISFIIMTTISLIGGSNNYILKNNSLDIIVFLLAGFLEAIGTILPGISSTALLMLMGVYSIFLKSLGNIYSFSNLKTNLYFLIPFSLGFIIGVIILVSLVNYLFKRYKSTSFSLILGISLSSIFALIINVLSKIKNIYMLIICIFFSILGYFITRKI